MKLGANSAGTLVNLTAGVELTCHSSAIVKFPAPDLCPQSLQEFGCAGTRGRVWVKNSWKIERQDGVPVRRQEELREKRGHLSWGAQKWGGGAA